MNCRRYKEKERRRRRRRSGVFDELIVDQTFFIFFEFPPSRDTGKKR